MLDDWVCKISVGKNTFLSTLTHQGTMHEDTFVKHSTKNDIELNKQKKPEENDNNLVRNAY